MPDFNPFGALVAAVTTASTPEGRQAAADALTSMLTEAGQRGVDVGRALLGGGPISGAAGSLMTLPGVRISPGQIQLTAIGNVQRFLADVASGVTVPTPADVQSIISQLLAGVGAAAQGVSVPGLPGAPAFPGLPFQLPNIPGLDPCKFLKCLAASMDCGCGGGQAPGSQPPQATIPQPPEGPDPVATMIGTGVEIFTRARALAEERLRSAQQRAADLLAAEKAAADAAAKAAIQKARKDAEKNVAGLKSQAEQLTTAIGTSIAQAWPRG